MIQLIFHLIGDYVTQSDWMANNKRKSSVAAGAHAIVYSLPFLFLTQSFWALATICWTHFLIDRFGLARYVVYAKNYLLQPDEGRDANFVAVTDVVMFEEDASPKNKEAYAKAIAWEKKWSWENCSATGYPSEAPPWLSVWLLIAADNTLHLAINYAALRWL